MANTKVSNFAAASALTGADLVPVIQGGTQKKSTAADIGTFVRSEAAMAELIRDTVGAALVAGSNMTITVNDAGDTITLASSGGGGGVAAHPGYVSGLYYPVLASGAGSATTVTADVPYAHLMYIPVDVTIQELGLRVSTGVAGNVKFAIYSNSGGRPANKLYDGNLTPSTGSSSSNVVTTFASNPTLTAGFYWAATIFSAAASIVPISTTDGVMTFLAGLASGASLSSNTFGVTGTGMTYAGGLASTFGTATPNSTVVPKVLMRIA